MMFCLHKTPIEESFYEQLLYRFLVQKSIGIIV